MADGGNTHPGKTLTGGKPPVTPEAIHAKYAPYLEEFDLTDEQARELLTALYEIMRSFVLIGFGLDSVQSVLPLVFRNVSLATPDAVVSRDIQTTDKCETDPADRAGEGGFE